MIKFLQTIITIAGFIVPLAAFFEVEGGTGEQKKKQVLTALMGELIKQESNCWHGQSDS